MLGSTGAPPAAGQGPDEKLTWPDQDPRVELERVITNQRDLGRGAFLRRLTGKPDSPLFGRPYGVAWDGEDLLTTDPAAGRVLRIPTRGKKLRTSAPDLFAGPIGVAVCSAGIVVTDSRSGDVALLDKDLGFVRWLARGLERPSGVACRGDQTFVAETGKHRVVVISPEEAVTTIGSRGNELGQFNFPAALAVDGDTLWVGDTLNFRLQKISLPSGQALTSFGQLGDAPGEMPRIKGVTVDRDGNLWISDAHLDQVALYAPSGKFLMAVGESGSDPGQVSFPAGVAGNREGKIAVVDSLNRRLLVFRLLEKGRKID